MTASQPDFFDPLHVALLRESEYYTEIARPFVERAAELKKAAFAACPHETLTVRHTNGEDEYGSYQSNLVDRYVTCDFCGKTNHMNRNKAIEAGLSDKEIFLREKLSEWV